MRSVFLLLSILPFIHAYCIEGEALGYLPAVIGQGGNIVTVDVEVDEGDGSIFISTTPKTGTMLQYSLETAVRYAFSYAGKDMYECNVFFKFDGPPNSYIEGPSGGASIALFVYSVITNTTIPSDVIITGTIEQDGTIGSVGGLYHKISIASLTGFETIIIPFEDLYETLSAEKAENEFGITVVEVSTFEDMLDVFSGVYEEKKDVLLFEELNNVSLEPYPLDSELQLFKDLADSMFIEASRSIDDIADYGDFHNKTKEYYKKRLSIDKQYSDSGYLFTAANDVFNFIPTLKRIKYIGEEPVDEKMAEVEECINDVQGDGDVEWVVGALTRRVWAEEKYQETLAAFEDMDRSTLFNSLLESESWCDVGKKLLAYAPYGEYNESDFKELAEEKMAMFDDYADFYVLSAERAYEEGYYGAAVFSSIVAHSYSAFENYTDEEVDKFIGEELGKDVSSFWAKLYRSQALYLLQTDSERRDVARLLFLSKELENIFGEETPTVPKMFYYMLVLIFSVILIIVTNGELPTKFVARRRFHGQNLKCL